MLFLFNWKRDGGSVPEVEIPRSGGAPGRRYFDPFPRADQSTQTDATAETIAASVVARANALDPISSMNVEADAVFAQIVASAIASNPITEINIKTQGGLFVSDAYTRRNRVGIIRTRPKVIKKGH